MIIYRKDSKRNFYGRRNKYLKSYLPQMELSDSTVFYLILCAF